MNFSKYQNPSCPGLLPVQCGTEASEPRERAAADDPTLVVADSPARSEQVIRRTTLGARRLHRDTTHDVNDALSGLGQAKNLAELGLNDRDRLDLAYQHIVLASPRHPATGESRDDVIVVIEDLHLVRGEIYDLHFPPFKGERA